MRLAMVGLDYNTADVAAREAFAPDAAGRREVLCRIAAAGVAGSVLLATCNRTELYLSYNDDIPPDSVALLCGALGRDAARYRPCFVERHERQAVEHLMRVAAGLQSSVPGDDQIITQVRSAVEAAREAATAEPQLEALFRAAVTAGKKVKTRVAFARAGASVVGQAVAVAEERLGALAGRRALVIGNGTMGTLAASELLARGCSVSITLRDPRRVADMPVGCVCVDFARRYELLATSDVVISATAGAGFTLGGEELRRVARLPALLIDLAVPRDIDPAAAAFSGVELFNIDDLRRDDGGEGRNAGAFREAEAIIAEEAERFEVWRRSRRRRLRRAGNVPDFPVFINLHGALVLVVGGGRVAARRVEKLLGFGARVRVVAPGLAPGMEALLEREGLEWRREEYRAEHMDGATLAIAATDRREVNRRIGCDARERGILVSVADAGDECTFFFPAIVQSDRLTAGLVSNNGDHGLVRQAAARLREEMEHFDSGNTFDQ